MKFSRRKAILASTLAVAIQETGLRAQEIETVNVKIGGILTLTGLQQRFGMHYKEKQN